MKKKINISNIPIIISDTAGLKVKPRNIIEKKSIIKSENKIKKSDLKLLVLDLKKKVDDKILDLICEKTLIILNKADIVKKKEILSKINYLRGKKLKNIYVISARTGNGINSLLNKIEKYVKNKYKDVFLGEPVLTRVRHRTALKKCLSNLKKIDNNKNPELNAEDLRLALNSLGMITGKYDIEKMLDIVFKDFCIGK